MDVYINAHADLKEPKNSHISPSLPVISVVGSPSKVSTSLPGRQSTSASSTSTSPTTISPSLSRTPRVTAKFSTSQVSPQPTTTLMGTPVLPSVKLHSTPAGNGCEETECNCQLRLDQMTLSALLEDLQLLTILILLVILFILLCCFVTACCVQCCVIWRHKVKHPNKEDSPAPVTNAAKAPSDENIYSDVDAAPPRRHRARHATSNKLSTASAHELAYIDGPQYCNTEVYRQNYPSNTF